jgi:hypothetical protein
VRKFSRLDLLNNAVVGNAGEIINRLFESKYVRLDITVPLYDLKRATVFVGTVNDLIEDETDDLFTVEKFIVLLYEDFLKQIEKGMDLDTLAEAIDRKLKEQQQPEMKIHHYVESPSREIVLDDVRRHLKSKKQNRNQMTSISFRILKKYVLRGEVLLHDLNEIYPKFQLDVEDLIALRFRDVMKQIKVGDYRILNNIVQNLIE